MTWAVTQQAQQVHSWQRQGPMVEGKFASALGQGQKRSLNPLCDSNYPTISFQALRWTLRAMTSAASVLQG